MCIAIVSTAHPDYPFILLDNRDEYLLRPTARATWWPSPHVHILGGYDLYRSNHGTWLGMTWQGRIAVLTNYREEGEAGAPGKMSRGQLPSTWLQSDPTEEQSIEEAARLMIEQGDVKGIGGFSLCYGFVQDVVQQRAGNEAEGGERGLAIISNRTPDVNGVIRILGSKGETRALSNTAYSDRTWPKVLNGEALTEQAIRESVAAKESREQLVERLLSVLSTSTMPARKSGESRVKYFFQLRNSIFVPEIAPDLSQEKISEEKQDAKDPMSGGYGTQKSIVILVDKEGGVYYLERTFYDDDAKPIEKGKGDRVFEFQIGGW